MLYTVVPIEQIMDQKEQRSHYQEMNISGIPCYVEKLSDFEYKIIRIHTSDPKKYLAKELQPGAIVNLKDKL